MFRHLLPTAFVLSLAAHSALAQEHQYTITGVITAAPNATGVWSGVAVSDAFTLVTRRNGSFDPTLSAFEAVYSAVFNSNLTIGAESHSGAPGSIRINNNEPLGSACRDRFFLTTGSGPQFDRVEVDCYTVSGSCPTVLSSLDEPLNLDILGFVVRDFRVFIDSDNVPDLVGKVQGFSLLVTSPPNDDCADATPLPSGYGTHAYDLTGATTDGSIFTGFCEMPGQDNVLRDIWYTYVPSVSGCTYITTLGMTNGYNTRLAIYAGYSCPSDPSNIVACADNEIQPFQSPGGAGLDVDLVAGQIYTIRLGTTAGMNAGPGQISILAGPGADVNSGGLNPGAPGCYVPPNDDCADAMVLFSGFSDTPFDMRNATTDGLSYAGFCDDGFDSQQNYQDLWFSYTPQTSACVYISTFGLAGFDTNLTIYLGGCPGSPSNIIACADDEAGPEAAPYEAGLDVQMIAGQSYLIRLGTQSEGIPAGSGLLRVAQGPGAVFNGSNPGAPECAADVLFEHDFEQIQGGQITPPVGPVASFVGARVDVTDRLPGSTQHLQAPSDGSRSFIDTNVLLTGPTEALAFSIMFHAREDNSGSHRLLSTFDGAGLAQANELLFDSLSGQLRLILNSEVVFGDIALPEDDEWHQVGFRFLNGVVRFYIDGLPAGSDKVLSSTAVVPSQTLEFALIEDPQAGSVIGEYYSNGDYDNAVLWRGTVDDLEMAARYTPGNSDTFKSSCHGDGGNQLGCTDCPCGNNAPRGTLGGCRNSAGTSARLLASGSASVAAADLRFEVSGAPQTTSALLISGSALLPANASNPCAGLSTGLQSPVFDGLRCAGQGLLRHGVRPSDANGDIGLTTAGWGTPNGFFAFSGFSAGQTKHFQVFYRDDSAAICFTGQNTSQAVTVEFTP